MSTRPSPPGERRFPDLDSFESIPDIMPADLPSEGHGGESDGPTHPGSEGALCPHRGQGDTAISCPAGEPTYGFARTNPIQVGGGPAGERGFLSRLTLEGRPIRYERLGSVCGRGRFLDLYAVSPAGGGESRFLFLDMYTCDNPRPPLGFGIASGRGRL